MEKRATPAAVAVRCPEHKKKNKKSREPEVLEIGAPAGGDRHEPAVRRRLGHPAATATSPRALRDSVVLK